MSCCIVCPSLLFLICRNEERAIYDLSINDEKRIADFCKTTGFLQPVLCSYYVASMIRSIELRGTVREVSQPENVALSKYFQERTARYSCINRLLEVCAGLCCEVDFSPLRYIGRIQWLSSASAEVYDSKNRLE